MVSTPKNNRRIDRTLGQDDTTPFEQEFTDKTLSTIWKLNYSASLYAQRDTIGHKHRPMELVRVLCAQLSVLANLTGDAEFLADAIAVTDGREAMVVQTVQVVPDLEATTSIFLLARLGQHLLITV
jgi:hypothetical protein